MSLKRIYCHVKRHTTEYFTYLILMNILNFVFISHEIDLLFVLLFDMKCVYVCVTKNKNKEILIAFTKDFSYLNQLKNRYL